MASSFSGLGTVWYMLCKTMMKKHFVFTVTARTSLVTEFLIRFKTMLSYFFQYLPTERLGWDMAWRWSFTKKVNTYSSTWLKCHKYCHVVLPCIGFAFYAKAFPRAWGRLPAGYKGAMDNYRRYASVGANSHALIQHGTEAMHWLWQGFVSSSTWHHIPPGVFQK